jgi:hypothetical protein
MTLVIQDVRFDHEFEEDQVDIPPVFGIALQVRAYWLHRPPIKSPASGLDLGLRVFQRGVQYVMGVRKVSGSTDTVHLCPFVLTTRGFAIGCIFPLGVCSA